MFCSKKDPNCRACPLRPQCEYAKANGRHLKEKPPASKGPKSGASPDHNQPATPEAAAPPVHEPCKEVPKSDLVEPHSDRMQEGACGQPMGTGIAEPGKQENADKGNFETADLHEMLCTPRADSSASAGGASRECQGALNGEAAAPTTPSKSTEGGTRPLAAGNDIIEAQGASNHKAACEAEAALPDIEDLEKASIPSKAHRSQGQELSRILALGEDCGVTGDMDQDTVPSASVNPRCASSSEITWAFSVSGHCVYS